MLDLLELASQVADGGDDASAARAKLDALLHEDEPRRRDVLGAVLAAGARGPTQDGETALLELASTAVRLLGMRDEGMLTEDEVNSVAAWCRRAAHVEAAVCLAERYLARAPHPARARDSAVEGIVTSYDALLAAEGGGDQADPEDGGDVDGGAHPAAGEDKEERALLRKLAVMCSSYEESALGIDAYMRFCSRLSQHPSPSVRLITCHLAVCVFQHVVERDVVFTSKEHRELAERVAETLGKLVAEDAVKDKARRVFHELAGCSGIGRAARLSVVRVASHAAVAGGLGSETRRWALESLGFVLAVADSRLQREPLTVATAADATIRVLVEESEDPGWDDRRSWEEDMKHPMGVATSVRLRLGGGRWSRQWCSADAVCCALCPQVWDVLCKGATPGQMPLLLGRLSTLTQMDDWCVL